MQVFDVKFLDISNKGHRHFILFGSDHPNIDALTEDLRENTVVSGVRLIWRRDGEDIVIDDEFPVTISKHAIYTISLPNCSAVRIAENG